MEFENVRAESFDPASRYGGLSGAAEVTKANPLDSEQAKKLQSRLMGGFQYERTRQAGNRYQMSLDHDYYDSLQLTDEDIAELLDRGQAPLVYNLVKRTADWVIGTEKRTRIDFKVLGRNKDAAEVEGARIKTDVLKYLSDVNKTPFHRSQAFREAVISGLGWLEDGVRADPDEEPIYSRKESWRNILYDSHSLELDGSDMTYLYRYKYIDLEWAQAMFPGREQKLASACIGAIQAEDEMNEEYYLGNRISGQDYLIGQVGRYQSNTSFNGHLDNTRDRVKLIECWYRRPVRDKIVMAKQIPSMHGMRYNAQNDDMRSMVLAGDASVIERVNAGVFYCIMTEADLLAMGRSPYRHNQFPFTPIWCYRRGRDNAPYGIIRPIRDPQDGFNRRMSKALFALSAYRVTMDSDAIDPKVMSFEDIRREAGRPDALIVKKAGKEIKVEQDRGLAEGHMKLAEYEAGLILDSSGVTADNLGMDSNAQSGKAIIAKQSEGAAVTSEIFDNLRFANQLQGEKQLSLAEQYITDERVVRITDSKGRASWKTINEIVQNPDGTTRVLNDIAATKSDFVIDQQDFNVSLRQGASEQLMDLAGKMGGLDPKIVLRIIEMAFDISNLPNKDDLVKTMQELTGHRPAEDAQTPEEKQAYEQQQQQQQAEQAKQIKQQDDAFQADLQEKLAGAELKRAQAEKALADAETARHALQPTGDITPEVQAQMDALAKAHDEAQVALEEHRQNVAGLEQQLKDRGAEIAATEAAAKHKAEMEHAAAVHAANKTHDAAVHTADRQFQPGIHPAHEEAMADVLQAVEELRATVADFEKKVEGDHQDDEKTKKALLDEVTKAIEKTVAAAVKANEKPEVAPTPAAPQSITFAPVINVDAKQPTGGPKTFTFSSDGKSITSTAQEDKPAKPKK